MIQIKETAFHRNGISGVSFYIVSFHDDEEERDMIGVLFPHEQECAVFDSDLIGDGEVRFGFNSWRGDHYEDKLREAIREHERALNKKLGVPEDFCVTGGLKGEDND